MITDTSAPFAATMAARTVLAWAWPTGRPIYPYTVQEIADGVDLYTRRLQLTRSRTVGGRYA